MEGKRRLRGSHRSGSAFDAADRFARRGPSGPAAVLFAALLLLGLAPPASAQAGTSVELSVGYDNRYVSGRWIPVSVTVESSQAISGDLEVSYPQPDGSRQASMLPIEVPGGGRKEFHLVMPGPAEEREVSAQVVSDDEVIAGSSVTPLRLRDASLVGVIGDSSEIGSFTAEPTLIEMIPAELDPAQLDLGAAALDSLSYVVAEGETLEALVEEQRDALMDWIVGGGRLLVAAEDPSNLSWPRESRAIEWRGSSVASADHVFAGGAVGAERVAMGEVMVTPGGLTDLSRSVVEAALRPSRASYGSGANEFFNDFGPSAESELINKSRGEGVNLQLSWFVGFLIVYLVLVGPVNYFVLKKRGRKELLWVSIPILALAFSGVAYGLARGSRGDLQVDTAGIVFASRSGHQGMSVAAVSSGTGGPRTFSFPTKAAMAPSFLSFFGSNQEGSTRLGADGADVIIETAPFSFHVARGAIEDFEGYLDARITPDGGEMRYEVKNLVPREVSDAVLLFDRSVVELGDIGAGETMSGRFEPAANPRPRFGRILPGGLRNALLVEQQGFLGPGSILSSQVVGSIEGYDLGIELEGRATGPADRFMISSPIEFSAARGGTVPRQAGRVEVVSTDGHVVQYNPGTLTIEAFQNVQFGYQPPPGTDARDIVGGTLTFVGHGPRQGFEIYDWRQERWIPLDEQARPRLEAELTADAFSEAGEAYFRLRPNRHGFAEITNLGVELTVR